MNDEINKKTDIPGAETLNKDVKADNLDIDSDIDDDIDLDKEIASLDDFLNSQDDDFQFDDEAATATGDVISEHKSSSMGKYIGYAVLLAALGGVGYAGMKYAPQLMGTSALNDLQANISDRNMEDFVAYDTTLENNSSTEIVSEVSDLTVTNDVMMEQQVPVMSEGDYTIAPEMGMIAPEDFVISPEVSYEDRTIAKDTLETPVAETIFEALDIAQNVETTFIEDVSADFSNMMTEEQDSETIDIVIDEQPVEMADAITVQPEIETVKTPDLMNNMERIPVTPLVPVMDNVDLPSLDDASIDTANKIMQMSEDEIIKTVEAAQENVMQVTEVVEDSTLDTTTQDLVVEAAIEEVAETVVKTVEVLEVMQVKTPKAVPVANVPQQPREPVVNNKSVTQSDPRLKTARAAYEKGDYTTALDLYNQVLKANPSDTSALTGRQLSNAKLRMSNTTTAAAVSAPAETVVTTVAQTQTATTNATSTVSSLIAQMAATPRDAVTALKLGDAYRAEGNKAAAAEWYRKALQLDVIYPAGLDRMSVYDRMAGVQ